MTSPFLITLCVTLPILLLLPSGVVGHAKLVSPTAWNSNPSKTQICGVGGGQNNPASFKVTTVDPKQLLTVKWTVVVGDGTGPISASIDTAAKVNPTLGDFSVKLASVGTNNPSAVSNTPYTITFQIPANTVCTGPQQTCTLRVISTSNWVACATISLAGAAPPATKAPTIAPATQAPTNPPTTSNNPTSISIPTDAPTLTPTPTPTEAPVPAVVANFVPYPSAANPCVVATGLVTCSSVNGQSVQLLGPSLTILDADVQDQVNFALTNSSVLTTPNVAGCAQAFTDIICAQAFPPCTMNVPMICTSSCQRVTNLCSPNTTVYSDGISHASLYDCANPQLGFTASISDSTGNCPEVNTGIRPSTTAPTDEPTEQPISTPKPIPKNHAVSTHSSVFILSLTIVFALIAHISL